MFKKISNSDENEIWMKFSEEFNLSESQLNQFKTYYDLLISSPHNLTAIEGLKNIINNHFIDSLYISKFLNLDETYSIADIGTGAGFPAIPLKIMFPKIKFTLIEVGKKRIEFLNLVIDHLELQNIEIYDLDWRTFLRKTNLDIQLFLSRASLQVEEMCRMFKPASFYKNSKLVYWASEAWQPGERDSIFVEKTENYKIGSKKRKFIFLKSESI